MGALLRDAGCIRTAGPALCSLCTELLPSLNRLGGKLCWPGAGATGHYRSGYHVESRWHLGEAQLWLKAPACPRWAAGVQPRLCRGLAGSRVSHSSASRVLLDWKKASSSLLQRLPVRLQYGNRGAFKNFNYIDKGSLASHRVSFPPFLTSHCPLLISPAPLNEHL